MRRALSHVEAALAISLALVLIPALFPHPGHQLEAVRQGFEQETARLLLEGELSLAREAALLGELGPGEHVADTKRWRGSERLTALHVSWQARPQGALWELTLEARWRSALGGERHLTLTADAPRRSP